LGLVLAVVAAFAALVEAAPQPMSSPTAATATRVALPQLVAPRVPFLNGAEHARRRPGSGVLDRRVLQSGGQHGGNPPPLTVRILNAHRDISLDLAGGNRIPRISERKARSVAADAGGRPVLGVDTLVSCDGVLYGKPAGAAEAEGPARPCRV